MFAALGLHWLLPEERLTPLQWLGVAIAFAGIAVAFLGKGGQAASNMLLGDAMGLMAGLLGRDHGADPQDGAVGSAAAKTLFYQMAVAAVLLLAYAAATGQAGFRYSAAAVLSVSFQAVAVALTSYLAWFWLLRRYLASRLSILSFMTPLFGVSFGVLILDEPLDAAFVLARCWCWAASCWSAARRCCARNCAAGRAEARPRGQPPPLLRRAPPRRPIPTPSAPRPPAPARNPTSPGRPAGRPPAPWRPARPPPAPPAWSAKPWSR